MVQVSPERTAVHPGGATISNGAVLNHPGLMLAQVVRDAVGADRTLSVTAPIAGACFLNASVCFPMPSRAGSCERPGTNLRLV